MRGILNPTELYSITWKQNLKSVLCVSKDPNAHWIWWFLPSFSPPAERTVASHRVALRRIASHGMAWHGMASVCRNRQRLYPFECPCGVCSWTVHSRACAAVALRPAAAVSLFRTRRPTAA